MQEILSQLHTMVSEIIDLQVQLEESNEGHVEQAASSVDSGHRNLQSAERHAVRNISALTCIFKYLKKQQPEQMFG